MSVKISVEVRTIRGLSRRRITNLSAANKSLWLGLKDGSILRYYCDENYTGRDSPKSDAISSDCTVLKPKNEDVESDVRYIFVDSKSFHCITCLASGDHWYSNFQSNDMFFLGALQQVFVRSLAFTENTDENSTGPFLIGTQHGSLVEGRICYKKFLFYFKTHFVIRDGGPILGLEMVPIIYKGNRTYVVVALSTKCLHEFFGGSTLQETLAKYSESGDEGLRYEVPLAAPTGEILVVEKSDGSHDIFWTNATGIIHSNIPRRVDDNAKSCLKFPPTVISYPFLPQNLAFSSPDDKLQHRHGTGKSFLKKPASYVPKSSVALNNNIFLLFDDVILVVSTIVGQQVASLPIPSSTYGELKKFVKDPISGTIWLFSCDAIYEVIVKNESDDAWHYYLLKGDTESALKCCRTRRQRDVVSLKAAREYFENGLYEDSARVYAQVESAYPDFEKVCLNFLRKQQEPALVEYITRKIQQLDLKNTDPRFIILTVWVVEIIGFKLRDLSLTIKNCERLGSSNIDKLKELYMKFKWRFSSLITSVKGVDELVAPINILLHTIGCGDECIEYAKLRNDIPTVVCYHIGSCNYKGALYELSKMPPGEKRDSLLLRFAPLLFRSNCEDFSRISFPSLNPNTLMPVLILPIMMIDSTFILNSLKIMKRILKSTEFNIQDTSRSLLWSLYIILLSNLPSEDPLLEVLSDPNLNFTNNDLSIALRYLRKKSRNEDGNKWVVPFIILQSLCGMYDDALELALEHSDINLAKKCAMHPASDFSKRRLWRKILQYSTRNKSCSIASIISESQGFIHIHDILQFLDKGTSINELKGVIEESLSAYEENMQEKRQEIEHLCNSIDLNKAEIRLASKRCAKISVDQECTVCGQAIFSKHFIVFPCVHLFHKSCIENTLKRILSGADLVEFETVKGRCESVADEKAISEYDNYLARSCLICGHHIILLASQPFLSRNDVDQVEQWAIS